ncbi:uncharacterized protein LOC108249358 isoform X2 [Kryptolebias marmoratus]|uniref:uncharacterized protein LOC108249358 isoform X2 n=1 Tax=Kryptolebias marmoratus TaxID=37003 RepID=UPI0018ACFEAC|nr:uncharacterized protein LOC108249358 isoform X2 [Kryptolebias marmoratus]
MMIKILLTLLLPGVLPLRTKVVYKKAGEMVALHCPPRPGAEAAPSWTGPSGNLTGSLSASADVLIHGHSLVFLAVSVNHQGNYSCFPGNAGSRFWFQVVVSTAQSGEHEGSRYLTTCFTQESCRLSCPAEDIPAEDTPSITSRGVTWRREGEASSARSFFPSVEEEDGGVYVCSRSYSYGRHVYNSSFTVVLDVQPSKQQRRSEILSPKQNDVFPVDLGSTVVIGCEAVVSSDFDEVFWLSETSFVDEDASLPVFYNHSRMEGRPAEELHLQAGVRPSELHLHHRHPQPKSSFSFSPPPAPPDPPLRLHRGAADRFSCCCRHQIQTRRRLSPPRRPWFLGRRSWSGVSSTEQSGSGGGPHLLSLGSLKLFQSFKSGSLWS